MPIGIAKINAPPSQRPRHSALDCNLRCHQPLLPGRQVIGCIDGKCDVNGTSAVVWWDGPSGQVSLLGRRATEKEQQHVITAHIESTKALILDEQAQTEYVEVKISRPAEIV